MIDALRTDAIEVIGRHPHASNAVFVVELADGSNRALYKPMSGERELWDFPDAVLGRREVAAYEFATALGLSYIPPTVWREDLEFGPGSLQLWIDDATIEDVAVVQQLDEGWLPVLDAELTDGTPVSVVHRDLPELRELALLDAIMNNADRKAGHLLRDPQGRMWAVDHGVTFHAEPKLRTVLWGFAGQPIEPSLLERLNEQLLSVAALTDALTAAEIDALATRISTVRELGLYPDPSDAWPPIPWPIF